MKFALCNEMFGNAQFADTFSTIRKLGYTGVEIAPFTLLPYDEPFDVRHVSAQKLVDVRTLAEDEGLTIVGLHWLLAQTQGFYLTSPDPTVRRRTSEYLKALVETCASLEGKIMVLGSPKQRNLQPGVSHEDAEAYACEVLHGAMSHCKRFNVTIALEPLGPAEGDFLLTAESAIRVIQEVDSPHCRLQLDVKAMSSEEKAIPHIIRDSRQWLAHFHANDPNRLGPGMGDIDFAPVFQALNDISYDGWVSVEVFDFEPGPERIGRESLEYMQRIAE